MITKEQVKQAITDNEYFAKIDDDGDLTFKYGSTTYVVTLDEGEDDDPVYLTMYGVWALDGSNITDCKVWASDTTQKIKGAKIAISEMGDSLIMIASLELFLPNTMDTSEIAKIHERGIISLQGAADDFMEKNSEKG